MRRALELLRRKIAGGALILEAIASLVIARCLLRLLAARRLAAFLGRAAATMTASDSADAAIARVRQAIERGATLLPMTFSCLPRALAARAMLRRRRVASVLVHGVARTDAGRLAAHAWLKVGDTVVVGGELAPEFTILARFS